VEITRVETAGRDCSRYGKPIVFWLDKMTVTLSKRSLSKVRENGCDGSAKFVGRQSFLEIRTVYHTDNVILRSVYGLYSCDFSPPPAFSTVAFSVHRLSHVVFFLFCFMYILHLFLCHYSCMCTQMTGCLPLPSNDTASNEYSKTGRIQGQSVYFALCITIILHLNRGRTVL